ncbi:hypothetical protein SAMN05660642_02772 [Geodermatophilus siccatus]|uniref:Uncharacterized protein n=1 Tax=Geodermatophilus siccatus TaxID=1137991 RepID=A0A1G9U4Q1_9ACTN|nr:hypothetical protein SAMN05660642_02772 [Geodermatophilus siccatus]
MPRRLLSAPLVDGANELTIGPGSLSATHLPAVLVARGTGS